MSEQDFNIIFSNRLRYYLNKYDMTQLELSKRLGVGTTSVYNWCNAVKTPRMDKIDKMCEIFHCQRFDLMMDTPSNVSPAPLRSSGTIPVVGRVAAGEPIFAEENIITYIDVAEKWNNEEYFGLVISGDSMEPKINDKDTVIIHKQEDAESGEIIIATINGDDAVCKRLTKYANGVIALLSINPNYEPIDVTGREDFRIIGKVVELRREI